MYFNIESYVWEQTRVCYIRIINFLNNSFFGRGREREIEREKEREKEEKYLSLKI